MLFILAIAVCYSLENPIAALLTGWIIVICVASVSNNSRNYTNSTPNVLSIPPAKKTATMEATRKVSVELYVFQKIYGINILLM